LGRSSSKPFLRVIREKAHRDANKTDRNLSGTLCDIELSLRIDPCRCVPLSQWLLGEQLSHYGCRIELRRDGFFQRRHRLEWIHFRELQWCKKRKLGLGKLGGEQLGQQRVDELERD
jgi:hypothetical protein